MDNMNYRLKTLTPLVDKRVLNEIENKISANNSAEDTTT